MRLRWLRISAVLSVVIALGLSVVVGAAPHNSAEGPRAKYHYAANRYRLPDPDATPGVTVILNTERVCATKWGLDVRHVTEKMKREVYAAYGAVKRKDVCCEVDHLISRELGGADDVKNIWPQPWTQAWIKDRVENWLHRQVCAGTITLHEAQRGIARDWTQYIDAATRRDR